ncbi:hypothetical protein Tco_0757006 [Tanacetum coccineum]
MDDNRKMMRIDEVHKFSDGTLTRIKEKLDFMVKDFKLFKFNKGMENRKWTEDDKRRSEDFIKDTLPILLSFTHCGNKSILRVLRIILVILPEHPSETKVFHNEDGNPARANIKQALGSVVPIIPTTVEETLAKTLMEIKAAKPKAKGIIFHDQEEQVSISKPTVSVTQPSIKDKGKAQLDAEIIEEERLKRQKQEEANIALIESCKNTQAMMEADRLLAERLQTRERGELTDKEKGKLFMELMEKRRKHFTALRAQEKRNRPPTKAQKRTQMSTYLKHMGGYIYKQLKGKSYDEIQKLFDKETKRVNTFVAMGSKAQESNEKKVEGSEEKAKGSRKKMLGKKRAVKEQQQESPKRQKLEDDKVTNKHEEVEADDTTELKRHLVIKKNDDIAIDAIPLATKPPVIGIDKEDLQTLWKLVKTKHGDLRPEDEHERVLWGDLKVMFEPDIRSDVWRNLQGYKVTIWKLFDSCGVHFVRNLKIQKMNIKFRGGLLGLKRLQGFLELLLLSAAGEKVYAAGLQLLEDFLLSRG